jgi:hypothetical protein
MSELVTKSVAQEQQEQKIETRTAVERVAGFTVVATALAVLAALVATVVYAQDKYSLKSPSGIAFSDFRGYEDWAIARTSDGLPPRGGFQADQRVWRRSVQPSS